MITSDTVLIIVRCHKVEQQIRMLKWETHKKRGTQKKQIYSLPFEECSELKIGTRNGL